MIDYGAKFTGGLDYFDYLQQHGTPEHQRRWQSVYDLVRLSSSQRQLLADFTRQMPVLCLAGAWCGDCAEQCPILQRLAEASSLIQVRYIDRDSDAELRQQLMICGGSRIPVVVFLSEDNQFVALYGDRTLAKYRDLVRQQLGPSCPTGVSPPAQPLLDAVVQDWLDEFERVQWLLRTSPRLRQIHGD